MTRITIEVPDDVAERVNAAAAERGVPTEQLAGEAVVEKFPPRRRLSFIGLGHSAQTGAPKSLEDLRRELAEAKHQQMLDERSPAEG
jgi:hypothetical protein